MLFPAVLKNVSKSKVCLIGEWSIAVTILPIPETLDIAKKGNIHTL